MLNVSSMNYNVPKLHDLKICSVEEPLTRFASGIMKSLSSPFFSIHKIVNKKCQYPFTPKLILFTVWLHQFKTSTSKKNNHVQNMGDPYRDVDILAVKKL